MNEDRDRLAREHYAWARSLLVRRYGADAESYAGVALLTAIDDYDAVRDGDFRRWATGRIINSARCEYAAEHGRRGSRRRLAEAAPPSVSVTTVAAVSERDHTEDHLIEIDKLCDKTRRLVALLRYLGDFDDADVAFILNRRSVRLAVS